MCFDTSLQLIQFKVSQTQPNSTSHCKWISVPIARKQSGDAKKFDADLYDNITMTRGDPKILYPTQNALWVKFGGIFKILSGLLGYDLDLLPTFLNFFFLQNNYLACLWQGGFPLPSSFIVFSILDSNLNVYELIFKHEQFASHYFKCK